MDTVQDPLLGCLVHLTKQNHKPFSPEVLCDGLPLVDDRLTPKLFIRAAKRAGFSAQVLRRKLVDISPLVLPAVLLLNDDQACILQEFDEKTGEVLIIQPESGGVHRVSKEYLEELYTGYAIFVRLEYRFQEQVSKLLEGHKGHWFWGTIKRSASDDNRKLNKLMIGVAGK
ncbi:MAG: cysteine peptidase family C39 domain-containing protein, partial [Neptuniibacter sp.]